MRYIQILILYLLSSTTSHAQLKSAFQFIAPKEVSNLKLSLDLTELVAQKKTNNYLPGTLVSDDGSSFNVEVRPRGKFRRKTCEIPPIKLKFSKKQLHALGLDTLNEVRLSLPCLDNADAEANVVREYLAYKIFEQISPEYHVKAKLVRIKLHDTHTEKTEKSVYALVTEHEEEIQARLGGGDLEESYNLPINQLDESQMALNAMFQYLIGNTDWDIQMIRNIYPYKPIGSDIHIVIPYDFDFSGFVSAPYARVASEKGIRTVRDRLLMAEGIPTAALAEARKKILDAKAEILALCEHKHLEEAHQADCRAYLEHFFQNMENNKVMPLKLEDLR
jgi:hypothetical protein